MSEPKKSSAKEAKQIVDVAHPGKSAPSDTSRSIITNRPLLKDPMVVEAAAASIDVTAEKPLVKPAGKVTIEPSEQPDAEVKDADQAEAPETTEVSEKPAPPDLEAEDAKQAEHDAVIQKLIDAKQYFLPIKTVEEQRSSRFIAIGICVSLLLAVAWVDVALDASLIQLGNVKPVTHFFSN